MCNQNRQSTARREFSIVSHVLFPFLQHKTSMTVKKYSNMCTLHKKSSPYLSVYDHQVNLFYSIVIPNQVSSSSSYIHKLMKRETKPHDREIRWIFQLKPKIICHCDNYWILSKLVFPSYSLVEIVLELFTMWIIN